MVDQRRTAALAGVLYLITHVTSVGAVILYGPLRTEDAWLSGSGSVLPQTAGAMLDVALAAAVVGTGAALYPLLRHAAPVGALAYALLRTAEAALILVGVAAIIALTALRDAGAAGDGLGLVLRELYDGAFLAGPSLIVAVHTVLLASILLRAGAVPRWIPVLGIAGALLVTAGNAGVLVGALSESAPLRMLAAVPIFAWEISLAVTLIATGLRLSAPASSPAAPVTA